MMISKVFRMCRIPLFNTCQKYARINRATKYFSTINEDNNTVGQLVKYWSNKFEHEAISEPVESIEHIIAHVIGTKKYEHVLQIMDLVDVRDERLSPDQISRLESLCECRMSRMPVQYIIGEWDFRDITLKMVPPVFIPRPETEILVDIILKRVATMKNEICQLLDIGCGSGAISLALVHASNKIRCTSIDKSLYACDLTRRNAEALGLRDNVEILNAVLRENGTVESETEENLDEKFQGERFDVIVSNPPYIPTGKLNGLAPEIKIYEDLRALDGGRDGLNLIKGVMKYASKALVPRGHLFMEVDPIHPEYIEFFTNKYPDFKLRHEHTYKDYCCNDRFVELTKLD